jgi:hypothetical protein
MPQSPLARVLDRFHGVHRMAGFQRFFYDGRSVVLYLFSEHAWAWHTPDSLYRLETRWRGNELQFRQVFDAGWQPLATFRRGRFEVTESPPNATRWDYERVEAVSDLDEEERSLVALRPMQDYSVRPLDGLDRR